MGAWSSIGFGFSFWWKSFCVDLASWTQYRWPSVLAASRASYGTYVFPSASGMIIELQHKHLFTSTAYPVDGVVLHLLHNRLRVRGTWSWFLGGIFQRYQGLWMRCVTRQILWFGHGCLALRPSCFCKPWLWLHPSEEQVLLCLCGYLGTKVLNLLSLFWGCCSTRHLPFSPRKL